MDEHTHLKGAHDAAHEAGVPRVVTARQSRQPKKAKPFHLGVQQ